MKVKMNYKKSKNHIKRYLGVKLKLLKHQQEGVAILWTIILFLMVTIIATAVVFYARQDMLETNNQGDRLEAYYVALSGIEIGYAALMANDASTGQQYIESFDAAKADVNYTHTIMDGTNAVGNVVVTIGSVTIDGKRWIQIKSEGQLTNATSTAVTYMRIDPENHLNIVRDYQ